MLDGGREIGQFVSDFIWYLRNLLLILTSDAAGDLVDASEQEIAELSALRGKVRPERVMRCIRIFSDLQGSLRFATSRRTLTEVALVRICRPQMERSDEALRERLANLEGTVETLMDSLEAGYVPAAAPLAPTAREEAPKGPPPKAAPEDLQRLIEHWETIRERAATIAPKSGGGMVKGNAKAVLGILKPSYDDKSGENILYLKENPEKPVNLEPSHQEALVLAVANAAAEVLEKSVEVRLALRGGNHPALTDLTVDRDIEESKERGDFVFDEIGSEE